MYPYTSGCAAHDCIVIIVQLSNVAVIITMPCRLFGLVHCCEFIRAHLDLVIKSGGAEAVQLLRLISDETYFFIFIVIRHYNAASWLREVSCE